MKLRLLVATFVLVGFPLFSCGAGKEKKTQDPPPQENSGSNKSKSPRTEIQGNVGGADIMIRWGAPSVRGREIWGQLVPYDNVWRTGADSASYVDFSKDVKIEGKSLKAGRYSIFTIPSEGEWTVIFNSVWNQWGAFDHDASKDILRVTVTPENTQELQESLKFFIDKNGFGYQWEKKKVYLKVS